MLLFLRHSPVAWEPGTAASSTLKHSLPRLQGMQLSCVSRVMGGQAVHGGCHERGRLRGEGPQGGARCQEKVRPAILSRRCPRLPAVDALKTHRAVIEQC